MTNSALDRRAFVSTCAAGCAGILLGGCRSMVTHPVPVSAGTVTLALAAYPALSGSNGAVKLHPEGLPDPVVVLALDGGFRAVSPICTHRGCTVDVQGERLVCPCHGSTYDREGTVLKGPAQRALARFPVTRHGDELVIHVGTGR